MTTTRTPMTDWEALEKALELSRLKKRQETIQEGIDKFVTTANALHHNHFAKHDGEYLDPLMRGH